MSFTSKLYFILKLKNVSLKSFRFRAINPVKYQRNYLENSVRSDGRELFEFRPTVINRDTISTAEGSALVKIGATTVICGIKAVKFNKLKFMQSF